MRLDLPDGLVPFAQEFSRFKTPRERTQGWEEREGEARGHNDALDTIGTLMLWHHLADLGLPVTNLLTANEGDEGDLRVTNPYGHVAINVKTSAYDRWDDDPPDTPYHVGIKEVELSKSLPDIYAQVFVHLDPPQGEGVAHVHLCGWIHTASPTFQAQRITTIPNTDGALGYWIPARVLGPLSELPGQLQREPHSTTET